MNLDLLDTPAPVAERQNVVDLNPQVSALPAVHQQHAVTEPVTPADILRLAMEAGDKDLDRLERLMAMQERFEQMQIRQRELAEADRVKAGVLAFRRDFAAFTAEGIVVPKTKRVQQRARNGGPGPSYAQTEYHVVSELLKPALGRHGFGVRFKVDFERGGESGGAWCSVTCFLEHREGHVESVQLGGPPDDSGAKNPLQEMQSSATFLMRHALLSITGTAQAGMDNDGRGARGYREEDEGGDGDQGADGGQGADASSSAPPPKATTPYPDTEFRANLPEWQVRIKAGKTNADRLIAFIQSKGRPFTDEQKATLRNTKPAAPARH